LAGFAVNWAGTGSPTQTVTSNPYSKRLPGWRQHR
jgi:hypothetical protein